MKLYVLVAVLAGSLAVVGTARAQDDIEKEMQNLELRKRQMELREREAQLDFQNATRKMELEAKKAELGKRMQMMQHMGPQMRGPDGPGPNRSPMGRPGMRMNAGRGQMMGGPGGQGNPGCRRMMGGPGGPGNPGCQCMMRGQGGPANQGPQPMMGGPVGPQNPPMPQVSGPGPGMPSSGHPSFHHPRPPKICLLMFMMGVLGCALIHILLAIWVYHDIRQRNMGSSIWIVIALLTGLFGTLVYAVVRIGDKQA